MSGTGLTLPAASGGVSDQTAAFAAELIDRSGKAPVIEAALAHRTGRPRPLPARAVLTALLCLALDDRPLFLTDATRLLFCQLSPASRGLLGVPGTATTERAFQAAYRRVRYCFGAICSVMDPSALPKNRRLTQDDFKARTRPMTPAQAEAARSRLEAFINSLLEASISTLTSEERASYDGCTGLDATPVPLFSRGPSKRAGLCASDPDGGWYVREGDHREREDNKGKPLRKIAWALEATIATTARPPGAPPAHPDLAIGLALARPGEDPGGTGARVLASAAGRGHKPGWLGYDRAYTAALPGRFQLPARALGYRPVMDYRIDQLGIQANTGGAILQPAPRTRSRSGWRPPRFRLGHVLLEAFQPVVVGQPLVAHARLLHDAPRADVLRRRYGNNAVQAERSEPVGKHGDRGLGRVALVPAGLGEVIGQIELPSGGATRRRRGPSLGLHAVNRAQRTCGRPGQRSAWEITAMPAIPQVTPRTVHKICEETRAPVAASAAQSRPDCCTAVIYLHTAIHRLCLTSPDVTQISAVTVVRAPTHCCSAGAHRQVAARIPTAPRAKQRTAVLRTVGQACRWTVCSIAVGTVILRYCRLTGAEAAFSGSSVGLRTASQAMPQ